MKELKDQVLYIIDQLENGYIYSENCEYGEYKKGDIMSGFDYISDVLDVEWVLNSDKTIKGARLLVAFGGPNIYIDTVKQVVEGYWWGDSYKESYTCDYMGVNDAVIEWFECT